MLDLLQFFGYAGGQFVYYARCAMQPKDRQKMCSHCEGRIPYEVDNCPYCGVDQVKGSGFSPGKQVHHQSLQDSLTAPYSPSHAARPLQAAAPAPSMQFSKPSMPPSFEKKPLPAPAVTSAQALPSEQVSLQEKRAFLPILFLSLAGNLMTIGMLQFLFSDGGLLKLEWNASYWFLYCLGSVPLFFFGLKKAGALKE